jgi:sec-independent protein translocase protein TatA
MITPPALIGPPGPTELILILLIIMIFFGVGKLPEVGKALGGSIKAFKEAQKPEALDVTPSTADLDVTETEAETVTPS